MGTPWKGAFSLNMGTARQSRSGHQHKALLFSYLPWPWHYWHNIHLERACPAPNQPHTMVAVLVTVLEKR